MKPVMLKFMFTKMRKTNGEPYTRRLVRTVRGQALGNLPSQDGKAPSAEPTIYQYLNCKKPFERLWISSLTDKAIREGLSNLKPGSSYDNLYRPQGWLFLGTGTDSNPCYGLPSVHREP